ncbi:hypothetical protein [Arthrospiribacter ruber]|uniref:Uncharacterized protein n=1 Tax=Arthrospiribacter ruber TaxID=2487934 RepID=A0A951MBP4_9BACT|nr:hypothetical protein [Arthrospiribacter ruber]MBW3466962.1 hypothetical protein [Arthrospiribacter ruber]
MIFKTSKRLRWVAAGAFGLMLVFNIMVSLEFDKDKILPSISLIELGNRAMAQSESGGDNDCGNLIFGCDSLWQRVMTNEPCTKEICGGWGGNTICDTFNGFTEKCLDGPDFACVSHNCIV